MTTWTPARRSCGTSGATNQRSRNLRGRQRAGHVEGLPALRQIAGGKLARSAKAAPVAVDGQTGGHSSHPPGEPATARPLTVSLSSNDVARLETMHQVAVPTIRSNSA